MEVLDTKVDRLFRLLDFFKSGAIQVSDFQRIMNEGTTNPYSSTGAGSLGSTLGGALLTGSTFDWKFSAVQQIGLILSKKFGSAGLSYDACADRKPRVNFEMFKTFLARSEALEGFNLTVALLQQLFSELDSHKKGYLSKNDWELAFRAFDWNNALLVQVKDCVQNNFQDWQSAFEFFCSFGSGKTLSENVFLKAVRSLTADRLSLQEAGKIWAQISKAGRMDKTIFRQQFEHLEFSGTSKFKTASASMGRTTI